MKTKLKDLCAARVRKCGRCEDCLHFQECKNRIFPSSKLGAYIASLQYYILPLAKQQMNISKIMLDAYRPTEEQETHGVYAVLRVKYRDERIIKIPLLDYCLDVEEIATIITKTLKEENLL